MINADIQQGPNILPPPLESTDSTVGTHDCPEERTNSQGTKSSLPGVSNSKVMVLYFAPNTQQNNPTHPEPAHYRRRPQMRNIAGFQLRGKPANSFLSLA